MTGMNKALLCATVALCVPLAAQARDQVPEPQPSPPPVYKPAYPAGSDASIAARAPMEPVGSMADALSLAYWTAPDLLSQRASLRSTDQLYPAARSAYGLRIDLQGSHTFTKSRIESTDFLGNPQVGRFDGFGSTGQAILTQPLFSFGRRSAAEADALARIAFGRNQLRLTEADTMLGAITAYVSVIRDRQVVEISRQNLELLDRQLKDESERFRVREITSTDLQQVETRYSFGQAQLLTARGQLGSSSSQFLQQVGALPADQLAPPMPLDLGVTTIEEAYAVAEANSALIRAAQAREKVSRAAIESAKKEQLPDVTLQGVYTNGPTTPYINSERSSDIRGTVNVNVPLIDSGGRSARIAQAQEANESDWRLIDSAFRATRQAVAQAWDLHRASLESLDFYRRATEAAQKAYDGAVIQQRAGARSTLDVLDLARDLLNVRTNYVTAQANEYLGRAQLLSAMGRLEAPYLIPGTRAYDPAKHFEDVNNNGDVPILTSVLSGIDSLAAGRLTGDRAVRDVAGELRRPSEFPAPAR